MIPMNTNGRSTAPQAHISTSDERRRQLWQHLFGTDTLPVCSAEPRWQELPGRAFPVLAYDLALRDLSQAQRNRFAGYVARKYGRAYEDTLAEMETAVSFPIKADNVYVVEPAEQNTPLALPFLDPTPDRRTWGGVVSSLLRERASLWRSLARV